MVSIAADSTCDLSRELLEKYKVKIIPLHILLGKKEYEDGVDLMPEEIYTWADDHKTTPKTSAPSVETVMQTFWPLLENGDDIVCFSISESMSTTANVMRLAARQMEAEDRVNVVDSANLSTGIGLLVLEAAKMAAQGKTAEEIVAEIERLKPLVRASFVVDTLTYLYRGGRCNGLEAMAGSMLKLHPKIVVSEGKMSSSKKYRGKIDKVIMAYVKDMEEQLLQAKKERVFITHSGCPEETILAVKNYLQSLSRFEEILITRAGGVISSHCGPGTLGVLFISREKVSDN